MKKSQKEITFTLDYESIGLDDVPKVGGKNASLGEMAHFLSKKGVNIPDGFATTADGYRYFLKSNSLEQKIEALLDKYHEGSLDLDKAGRSIRQLFHNSTFPTPLAEDIRQAYLRLSSKYHVEGDFDPEKDLVDVAVRSSATAEDLPHASFAGQQETFLNVQGVECLIDACKKCYASLFMNRAIVYRENMGFDHMKVALSVGVQKMVRASSTCSGVMFTIDTESGFENVVLINSSWGLGENIVKGTVTPDQFCLFKPLLNDPDKSPILEKTLGSKRLKMVYSSGNSNRTQNVQTTLEERHRFSLTDDEILLLARWGVIIEDHYSRPMDIEWVKDEETNQFYIVQARPETVHSRGKPTSLKSYAFTDNLPPSLLTGLSIGSSIVNGRVKIVHNASDLKDIDSDTILVTEMTEPDWVPALKQSAGIITDYGGRTCHAAIVSRELSLPAVVGTGEATKLLKDEQEVTLSTASGETGIIYPGLLEYSVEEVDAKNLPKTDTKIMINLATPESAFKWWMLPASGVGLARLEFIISIHIKIHPMALVYPERVTDEEEFRKIRKMTSGYSDMKQYFVDKLAEGVAKIAASRYPDPVIVRTSDFKTNEYAGLIGGKYFEPHEENPMLGWRGACRYYSEGYSAGFELECRALKKVREQIGLTNVIVMIPFCRSLNEAGKVLDTMSRFGLKRGINGLKIYMMCEIPSNVILAEKFSQYFDGFSIGSNDLTQLILGVDRDSENLSHLLDENDPAVKEAIRDVIEASHRAGTPIGFCGQAPSDDADYAKFLVECGINSISVVPDSVIDVIKKVAEAEKNMVTA